MKEQPLKKCKNCGCYDNPEFSHFEGHTFVYNCPICGQEIERF